MKHSRTAASIGFALMAAIAVRADSAPQGLPFTQSWTDANLVTANDVWTGVPGIQGFLGQDITTATGVDPQTLLGTSAVANDLDVIANQSNTNITNGGVAEFDGIANPTIALNGSGTADAPHIVLYLNTLGRSGITVSYVLRDLDASADNAVQPVALQYRAGNSGPFTNVPAGFVADATSGPSVATLVTPVSVTLPSAADNQAELHVRIITANAAGNDEWVGVDDISVTSGGGTPTPSLSVSDVSVSEGASGVTQARFLVTLSAPAPAAGVTFDIATADGTATASSGDYSAQSLTGQVIPSGASQFAFDVDVLGDGAVEANETFFVNVANVAGAIVGDGQGQATIVNDDVALTAIAAIQGAAAVSPLVGTTVTTRGVVTGRRSNAFFLQEPDASIDGNPLTSEGILVFTGGAPPAAAAVGSLVQVSGLVTEFVPSADPGQPPLTELAGAVTVTLVASSLPLPAPITLTTADVGPASAFDALERFEGMRVSVPSLTVTGPTLGSIAEASATATSSGVFYGVLTGVARPFREPGVQVPDALPAGSPAGVPRFDTNPERIRVDSDGQPGAAAVDAAVGAVVSGLVGPLDYAFRTYTILPDPASPLTVTGGAASRAVRAAGPTEVTISGFNLERFFDTVDDPGISDVALTIAAFESRLAKASASIRGLLRTPDILGVVEMENLATLQALADRISADAVAAGELDPNYEAYLVEGNDIGGIDVGFLVKTAVVGASPRVTVHGVVQEGATTTYTNPNTGLPETLNDRPPLVLDATVNFADGRVFPVTVIVNHLRSLNDVANETAQGSGTLGLRVRAKRAAQAEYLAQLVQSRQVANPSQRIVLVGDFNAFEFSDGLVDVIGTIKGTPADASEVVRPSADLVEPNLVNLMEALPAGERYSFVFDGNAQVLDHVLVNGPARAAVSDLQMARGNADLPETARNAPTSAVRLSDHDVPVAYFRALPADVTASVRITRLPLVFNPLTRVSLGVVLVTNTSAAALSGPLHVVFGGLTPGVTLLNADGVIGETPYETLNVSGLERGHTTAVLIRFANPNRASISYTPQLLRGAF